MTQSFIQWQANQNMLKSMINLDDQNETSRLEQTCFYFKEIC